MRKIDHALPDLQHVFSSARSELWLPEANLASCIRAVLTRDTRGAGLAAHQRYNHIPASPLCAIVWYFHGDAELLAPGLPADAGTPRARISSFAFCGPSTRPMITWNPGDMETLVILMLPDALQHLTGIDPGAYLNCCVPAEGLLGSEWHALGQTLHALPDNAARVRAIETCLSPRWQQTRPDAHAIRHYYADWSTSLMLRAATSGFGRSLRQVERRIKQWAGLPMRELKGLSRAEQAFFDAAMREPDATVNWSDIAAAAGYTDQSHMIRATRKITGFAPDALRRLIFSDECFWVYRLWGMADQFPE
ncbi:helix-turn-helix domain-containing protein [Burkholderiaceae bacterium DAT-1]|nr:helix-turn-helix domain-containing protein [Burkholderiaceae bacterium DAT-1]